MGSVNSSTNDTDTTLMKANKTGDSPPKAPSDQTSGTGDSRAPIVSIEVPSGALAEVTEGSPRAERGSASGEETAKTPVSEKRLENYFSPSGESDVLRLDLSDDDFFSEGSARKTSEESDEEIRILREELLKEREERRIGKPKITSDAEDELLKGSDYDDEELEKSDRLAEEELLKSSDEESRQAAGEKLLKGSDSEEELENAEELLKSSDEESQDAAGKKLLKSRFSEEELKCVEEELLKSSDEELGEAAEEKLLKGRDAEAELKCAEEDLLKLSDDEEIQKAARDKLLEGIDSEEELKSAEEELLQSIDRELPEAAVEKLLEGSDSEEEAKSADEEFLKSSDEESPEAAGENLLKGSDSKEEERSFSDNFRKNGNNKDCLTLICDSDRLIIDAPWRVEDDKNNNYKLKNDLQTKNTPLEVITENGGGASVLEDASLSLEDEEPGNNLEEESQDPSDEETIRLTEDGKYMVFSEHSDEDESDFLEGNDDDVEIIFVEEKNLSSATERKPVECWNKASSQKTGFAPLEQEADATENKLSIEDDSVSDDPVSVADNLSANMPSDTKPQVFPNHSPNELSQRVEDRVLRAPSQTKCNQNIPHSQTENIVEDDTRTEVKVEVGVVVGPSQSLSTQNVEDTPRFKIESPEAKMVSPKHAELHSETENSPEYSVRSEVGSSPGDTDIGNNFEYAKNPSPPSENKPIPRIGEAISPHCAPSLPTPLPSSGSPTLFARRPAAPQQTDSGRNPFTFTGRQPVPLCDRRGPPNANSFQGAFGGNQFNHGSNGSYGEPGWSNENGWDNQGRWDGLGAWDNTRNVPTVRDYQHSSDSWNQPLQGLQQLNQFDEPPPRIDGQFGATAAAPQLDFVEDVSLDAGEEFVVHRYSRENDIIKPDEIEDNNDPRWAALERQTTDAERCVSLRERWGNPNIPDPRKNLTTHNFLRKNRARNPQGTDPFFTNGRKRRASSSLGNERPGKRLCTILDDKFRNADREANREMERLFEERTSELSKVDLKQEEEISDLVRAYGGSFIHDSFFDDIYHRAAKERESITFFYENRIQQVYQRNLKLKDELQSALDEMEAFYKFYGNDFHVHLTPEEEQIFAEQEQMFSKYDKFYTG